MRAKADGAGVRHIHEADLWEISVVTFPMLPSARVGQVKSQAPARQMPAYTHQPRLLWNIKANELLLGALKRATPSHYNRRWIENLEAENLELKRRSTRYEAFQHWLSLKFDPNQPRVSAGNSDGGQWTDGGGGAGGLTSGTRFVSGHGRFAASVALPKKPDGPRAPDGTPAQLAMGAGSNNAVKRKPIEQGDSDQPATKFTDATKKFITRHAGAAERVAKKLGVSTNALVGAVANEYDVGVNPDLRFDSRGSFSQGLVDKWAKRPNHQDILDNYNAVKEGKPYLFGKVGNPVRLDVGPGNINIETAIDLLQQYGADQLSGGDPLDLQKYVNHYDTLVKDLCDFDKTDTTFAIAGLKVRQADRFFVSKDSAAWDRAGDDVKDALRITYYKMSPDKLSRNIDKRTAAAKQKNTQFDFNPHGDGGQQHLNNLDEVKRAIQEGLSGSQNDY